MSTFVKQLDILAGIIPSIHEEAARDVLPVGGTTNPITGVHVSYSIGFNPSPYYFGCPFSLIYPYSLTLAEKTIILALSVSDDKALVIASSGNDGYLQFYIAAKTDLFTPLAGSYGATGNFTIPCFRADYAYHGVGYAFRGSDQIGQLILYLGSHEYGTVNNNYTSGYNFPYNSTMITINTQEYLASLRSYYGDDIYSNWGSSITSPDYGTPSTEEGYGVGGQYGTFDDSSDTISLPTMPTMGMTSTGFVNVYEISQSSLTQFGAELFPDLSFTPVSQLPAPTDVTTALENIATVLTDFGNQIPNMIDMYINNTLINYILDCHIIPVAPQSAGTSNIKVGFRTFTPLVNVVTNDYIDFDCGSLNIGEYYGNFIDYAPYTSAKLFLPFVGFVEVLPEFWQAGTLGVKYRFNIIDGSFMCYLTSTSSKSKLSNTVIAQYGGNCCIHIPITGANYSNMITGLVGAAAGVATHGAGASSIVGGMASAINAVATRSGMQSSNSYNSSTAFLGIRVPYLLIERTVADFSETYDSERGLPSNISTSFSSLSGFTSSSTVHLDGITGATSEELDELSALLAGGVIL